MKGEHKQMEEIQIIIYGREDLKKSGGFKKRNNVRTMSKTAFFIYLRESDLNIKSQYFDHIADISNGKKFRCYWKKLMIGTSKICEEFNNGE